jgi:hypothetical protein
VIDDDIEDTENMAPEVVSEENERFALVPSSSLRASAMDNDADVAHDHSTWLGWLSIGVFFGKIMFLIVPCSPYVCSTTILYPLLGLACLDVFLYAPDVRY